MGENQKKRQLLLGEGRKDLGGLFGFCPIKILRRETKGSSSGSRGHSLKGAPWGILPLKENFCAN